MLVDRIMRNVLRVRNVKFHQKQTILKSGKGKVRWIL